MGLMRDSSARGDCMTLQRHTQPVHGWPNVTGNLEENPSGCEPHPPELLMQTYSGTNSGFPLILASSTLLKKISRAIFPLNITVRLKLCPLQR